MKKVEPNFLDKCISYLSPSSGEKRIKSRMRLHRLERRGFSGGLKGGRLKNWNPGSTDADSEILSSLAVLRNRSRDLIRNTPHALSAIDEIVDAIVGTGINTRFSDLDEDHKSERERRFQKVWRDWSDSTECDFDGKLKLRGIQRLVVRSWLESGEVLIRLRKVRKKIPFQIQVIEGDFIADHLNDGDKIKSGIEYDSEGRVSAYHLYKSHPGSSVSYNLSETVRVDSSEIIHVFSRNRPGQTRGIPRLAPVILKINDLDEFEDAEIVRQKISSCFSAFIYDVEPGEDLLDDEDYELGEKMSPGNIEFLPPGKKIEFGNPPTKDGYAEFSSSALKSIAAGAGVSYEGMTGDYSKTTYSAGKMARNKFNRSIKSAQQLIVVDIFLDRIVEEFKRFSVFAGVSSEGIVHRHTTPRVEMIEPVKETNALIALLRSGLKAWDDAVSELGEDPDHLLSQIALDRKRFKELDLILDSDSNAVQSNGKIHAPEGLNDHKDD
jgi:lambda family phage portal protein